MDNSEKQTKNEYNNKVGRRSFIKKSLTILSAVPVTAALHRNGLINEAHAQSTAALDENFPQAKALGYLHDATKVDTTKYPKRAGDEGAKQFCKNCQLLTQSGMKADGQEGEWGKCAIFPTGLVNVNGWCNSWVLKAG